jgi:hypothetical protein
MLVKPQHTNGVLGNTQTCILSTVDWTLIKTCSSRNQDIQDVCFFHHVNERFIKNYIGFKRILRLSIQCPYPSRQTVTLCAGG